MTDEKRVVLIKPGDVLLIGNVGDYEPEALAEAGKALRSIGLPVVLLFVEDIQLDALTAEQLADLTARRAL